MSREIVIRDVYAALMSDEDWDGTTAESIDEVLDMYGYSPENPGHGIIGQISDILYSTEDWDRATTNAIALALAEDSDRRRTEALGPMVRNGSPAATDALMDHLEENPPKGGMIEFEEEGEDDFFENPSDSDFEENPLYRRRGRGGKVEFIEADPEPGDEITYLGRDGEGQMRTYYGTARRELGDGSWEVVTRLGELEEVHPSSIVEVVQGKAGGKAVPVRKGRSAPRAQSMRVRGKAVAAPTRGQARATRERAEAAHKAGSGYGTSKRVGVVKRRR